MNDKKNKVNGKNKIKDYRNQLKSHVFDASSELDLNNDGNAIIECNIGQKDAIFSKFDILKDRAIDQQFNDYLLEETEIIPLKYDLEIKMHVDENITNDEAKLIGKAIKRHFSYNITKSNVKIKKSFWGASILYFFGFLALLFIPLVSDLNTKFPLTEFLLILVWFCIWEASDIALFNRGELKRKRITMLRLYNAKISFVKDDFVQQKIAE